MSDITVELRLVLDKVLCDMRRGAMTYQVQNMSIDDYLHFTIPIPSDDCIRVSAASICDHLRAKGFPWRRNPLLSESGLLTRALQRAGLLAHASEQNYNNNQRDYVLFLSLCALDLSGFKVEGMCL